MNRNLLLNPFYPLVVLTGVAFVVTALAYVVAWVVTMQPDAAVEPGPVVRFMNERGERLLIWEVGALAILAVLAMGLDQWRQRSTRHSTVNPSDRS